MVDLQRVKQAIAAYREKALRREQRQAVMSEMGDFEERLKREGKDDWQIVENLLETYQCPIDELATDLQDDIQKEKQSHEASGGGGDR